MLLTGYAGTGGPDDILQPIIGLFVIFVPAMLSLAGWTLSICMIIAGTKLAKLQSRFFCIVVAAFECAVFPSGTILGIFTIIVLMNNKTKQLFKHPETGPSPEYNI